MGPPDFAPRSPPSERRDGQECCLFPRWEEAMHESMEGKDGALPQSKRGEHSQVRRT